MNSGRVISGKWDHKKETELVSPIEWLVCYSDTIVGKAGPSFPVLHIFAVLITVHAEMLYKIFVKVLHFS
jgi:hypothetical protein